MMEVKQERRINRKLLAYWDELRGTRDYPSRDEIVSDELDDIWDHCFMIKIGDGISGETELTYSYIGEGIIEAYGENLTGDEVHGSLLCASDENFLIKLEEVLETGQPVIDESEFVNMQNQKVKYRLCMLPLSSDGNHIDTILGGMRWKLY